jgi:hypothetical protein
VGLEAWSYRRSCKDRDSRRAALLLYVFMILMVVPLTGQQYQIGIDRYRATALARRQAYQRNE